MTLMTAALERHSVRRFLPLEVPAPARAVLMEKIREINAASGLHIQFIPDHPEAFHHFLARSGAFENLKAYFALVGQKGADLEEKCGYYGEELVLTAQTLGLGTCWIGGTYSKKGAFCEKEAGETLALIIAVGVPKDPGKPHKSRKMEQVMDAPSPSPWFLRGMESALLAPTAINQQKFLIRQVNENTARAIAGVGPFSRVDLGIVKYHFELGAGRENFRWAD